MITPPMGEPPSPYPFSASRNAMRMKSLSLSFLKNPSSTTLERLFVGISAIVFKTSSVTGVSLVIKAFITTPFRGPKSSLYAPPVWMFMRVNLIAHVATKSPPIGYTQTYIGMGPSCCRVGLDHIQGNLCKCNYLEVDLGRDS